MPSSTTVDLTDIYGLNENHIWIAGANYNDGHSVILSFDGNNWNKIYDSDNVPVQDWYDYKSVWTDNTRSLYLASSGLLRKLNITTMKFTTINTGQTFASYYLRGRRQNDIFLTGQGDEVLHWNGSSWHVYKEINYSKDAWWFSVYPTNDFVLIGGDYYFGYNTAPLVARGYR